jgi:hypothetical protein
MASLRLAEILRARFAPSASRAPAAFPKSSPVGHQERFTAFRKLALKFFIAFILFAAILLGAGAEQASQRVTSSDPALRLKGFEQHQQMKLASPFKDLKWQFLGPKNVSGRCTDIAVVAPKGKNYTIYVATASGGLWKTDNEATTWEPVFDQAPSTAIGDVAAAPSNPNIVWIGTGEANIFRSSQAGIGVYKSLDAGKIWQHVGLADTYTIPRIIIHPTNPDIVYVAASGHEWTTNAERGVYKTTDGGKTWQKILYSNEKTGAIDLVMDPMDANTLYAATWQRTRLKWIVGTGRHHDQQEGGTAELSA